MSDVSDQFSDLPVDPSVLLDYVDGRCSATDAAAIERWSRQAPEHQALLHTLESSRTTHESNVRSAADQAWVRAIPRNVLDRIDASKREASPVQRRGRAPRRLPPELRRAVPLGLGLCLLVAGIVWTMGATHTTSTSRSHVYHTTPGQRSTVQLSDGSNVILAPATTVTETEHELHVSGEAYFTIQPHAARPFLVQTRNATVQVLGTRFVVRQYPDERDSRVVVEDGKVALRVRQVAATNTRADRETVLPARTLARVTDSGAVMQTNVDTRTYTAWTQGSLVFDGTPLSDVVLELSRSYGVPIRVQDSALMRRSLALEVFVSRDALPHVLDMIGVAVNAHYSRDGQGFLLSPGSRTAPAAQQRGFPSSEPQYGR